MSPTAKLVALLFLAAFFVCCSGASVSSTVSASGTRSITGTVTASPTGATSRPPASPTASASSGSSLTPTRSVPPAASGSRSATSTVTPSPAAAGVVAARSSNLSTTEQLGIGLGAGLGVAALIIVGAWVVLRARRTGSAAKPPSPADNDGEPAPEANTVCRSFDEMQAEKRRRGERASRQSVPSVTDSNPAGCAPVPAGVADSSPPAGRAGTAGGGTSGASASVASASVARGPTAVVVDSGDAQAVATGVPAPSRDVSPSPGPQGSPTQGSPVADTVQLAVAPPDGAAVRSTPQGPLRLPPPVTPTLQKPVAMRPPTTPRTEGRRSVATPGMVRTGGVPTTGGVFGPASVGAPSPPAVSPAPADGVAPSPGQAAVPLSPALVEAAVAAAVDAHMLVEGLEEHRGLPTVARSSTKAPTSKRAPSQHSREPSVAQPAAARAGVPAGGGGGGAGDTSVPHRKKSKKHTSRRPRPPGDTAEEAAAEVDHIMHQLRKEKVTQQVLATRVYRSRAGDDDPLVKAYLARAGSLLSPRQAPRSPRSPSPRGRDVMRPPSPRTSSSVHAWPHSLVSPTRVPAVPDTTYLQSPSQPARASNLHLLSGLYR